MKKRILLLPVTLIILGLCIVTSSCKKEDPPPPPPVSPDGLWTCSNFDFTISGTIGTFTAIRDGGWADVLDKGFISIGSMKFRNIIKTGDLIWSCDELWYWTNDMDIPYEVGWSTSGTITLNSYGNTMSVWSEVVEDGETYDGGTLIFYRQ